MTPIFSSDLGRHLLGELRESLVCAVIASNCLRACAVDSSMNSDGDFTPNSS